MRSSNHSRKMYKLQNIQALRGVAVLCVVLFHMLSVESKYGGGLNLLPIWFEFGQFGVDLFFVISGFVMMTVTHEKFGSGEAGRFLYHRATRIFPLYWLYSTLLFSVYLYKPTWVIGSHDRVISIVDSFLLLPQNDYPLLSVGWTLIHEMYFYLVFFVIICLGGGRLRMSLLGLWAIAVITLNLSYESASAAFGLVSHPLTIEFIAGCYIAAYTRSSRGSMHISQIIAVSLATVAVSVLAYMYYKDATGLIGPAGWWRIGIFGLPACLLVFYAIRAEQIAKIMSVSLRDLGDVSYSVYLSHTLVLISLGKLWGMIAIPGLLDNVIMLPVLFAATLVVANLSYRYVERPVLNYCRRWF